MEELFGFRGRARRSGVSRELSSSSRLGLVPGGAAVWHLEAGLAAAAVLDGFWRLSRRRGRACEVGKTSPELFFVLDHVGLQVMAVALQRVARLLQAAHDGLW